MVIKTNVPGLLALGENKKQQRASSKVLEKLSSGFRINRAADDAAGLGVSESMRARITELERCQANVDEGINVTNTADGALAEINDMLVRAKELTVEAANGVYADEDRNHISAEMNELFDEIDHITAGTMHNDIQLFRMEVTKDDIPEVEIESHIEYIETFEPTDPTAPLSEWGKMDFVQDANFDRPEEAKRATSTLVFDKDIDLDDASTLVGKSVIIGGTRYNFNDASGSASFPGGYTITVNNSQTVEDAMKILANRTGMFSAKVDKAARSVTFEGQLSDYYYTVNSNGEDVSYNQPQGDGTRWNTTITSSETSSLKQVDNINNSTPTYEDEVTLTTSIFGGTGTLTAADIENLKGNTYYVNNSSGSGNISIVFKDLINAGTIKVGTTRDQLGKVLADEINKHANYKATYTTGGKLEVVLSNVSTTQPTTLYTGETTTSQSGGDYTVWHPPEYDYKNLSVGGISGITAKETKPHSSEGKEEWTVTVPDISASVPFTFQVEGRTYCLYAEGSDEDKFPPAGYTDTSSGFTRIVIRAGEDAQKKFTDIVAAGLGSSDKIVVQNGNTFTVTAKRSNQDISVSIGSSSASFTSYKETKPGWTETIHRPVVPGTSRVLGSGTDTTAQDDPYVRMNLPVKADGTLDIDKLAESGFTFNGMGFEFVNGAGAGISTIYNNDIDISAITDPSDLVAILQTKFGAGYTVEEDPANAGQLKITFSNYNPGITDGSLGIDGIFTNKDDTPKSANFSGGTIVDHAKKEIDFSSINADNLDTLLGKGFRITCATCVGEYINVFFCMKNDGRVPESFEVEDPVTKEKSTIHNVVVELGKVTDGSNIVKSIVEQIKPTLKHYTDVDVGDPPTSLACQDKRVGDIFENNILKQAQIISGLKTNFNYTVEKKVVIDNPPGEGDIEPDKDDSNIEIGYHKMTIYAGSEPKHQFIPIHLPYLDLLTLNLRPPEKVDLGDGHQNTEDWMERVDKANDAIVTCRGRIGADNNRLEHTKNALSNAHEQTTASESRIRDADMAKLMAEQIQLSILGQAQTSMMAQANVQPQQVLQLLK